MTQRPKPDTRNAGFAYWKAASERRFVLPACVPCGKPFWHPRRNCPYCGSEQIEWNAASGKGTIHTYTVVRQSAHPWFRERVPYVVAMIELDEGPLVMSNVVECDPEAIRIGLRVRVTFEQLDADVGVPLFVPEGSAA